jgi:hypothetical protein
MAAVNEVFFCWPFAAKTEHCTSLAGRTCFIAFLLPVPACGNPMIVSEEHKNEPVGACNDHWYYLQIWHPVFVHNFGR